MYQLATLDWIVFAGFIIGLITITYRHSHKTDNTDDYFLAGRSAKGWVIGLSFIGTSISSLSFLAFPAASYRGNWSGLVPFLVFPLVAFFAHFVCIPLYRRTHFLSGYELLQQRFGSFARLYGSLMFLLLQIGRAGLILVLLSLPLSLLTGLDQMTVILLCGAVTTTYVFFGGLGAVLLIDVFQTLLLAVGGVVCIAAVLWQLPEAVFTVTKIAVDADKFQFAPWLASKGPWYGSFVQLTMIVLLLHGLFNQMLYLTADQNIIQRYLAAKTDREARKGLWIGSLGVLPVYACFTLLGTCLFAFYQTFPDPSLANMTADDVLPHFILTQLPSGLVGLIIVAIIAAAMSSLDSNLNAITLVFHADIYKKYFAKDRNDRHYLRVAKGTTLMFGAIITGGALALTFSQAATILDLMFLVYAIFAGGLAGLFLLAMLSRRANQFGVEIGIITSVIMTVYLTCSYFGLLIPKACRMPIHPYLIGAMSNVTLLVVGYLASLAVSLRER